jgi:hypothetical protein
MINKCFCICLLINYSVVYSHPLPKPLFVPHSEPGATSVKVKTTIDLKVDNDQQTQLAVSKFGSYAIVDGTTGTPLGGLGTGAVKFRAGEGTFTFNDQTPTRYGDYQSLMGAQFQLYTKRNDSVVTSTCLKALRESGRIMDDAIFPAHRVDFGDTNGIDIFLNAFGPFDPSVPDSMALPCAFYEFTFTNSGTSEAEVSIAFQMATGQNPVIVLGKGFADDTSLHQKCVFVQDDGGSAVVSVGSGDGFFQTGISENIISGRTNRTAAYFKLASGDVKTILFVFAWYNQSDPERYYYTKSYNKVTDVANAGLVSSFTYKQNTYSLVNRMRASNLPGWIVNQALNALVNLVNNSIYTADGRYCHNEGMYPMNGTMDQMWHARQINIQLLPEIAWKELEYWARCQKKAIGSEGQIHHDFGSNGTYEIAQWDESEYADYRDIDKWVDLNCGFIISVYEAYIATADRTKLGVLWPYVKKAGQRILNQVKLYGDPNYSYTFGSSESSYDAGGNSQAFNSGLSIVAYKILRYLAMEVGESGLASTYEAASDTAVNNFSKRWLDQPLPTGHYCESIFGGVWIANFLKLGQFWPSNKLDNAFFTVSGYYDPLNNGLGLSGGSYSEWQTYLVAHLGGYSLQTQKSNIWRALQFDMYERNTLDRNRVFNEELGIPSKVTIPIYEATSASGSNQYISIPVVWRNYYDLVGFHRNKPTGELWLEPNIPEELNHVLSNALVVSPEGYFTISATESGEAWQNQTITLMPDQTLQIDTLYVKDRYGDTVRFVQVNGIEKQFVREGTGYQKRLKIFWSGIVGHEGLIVEVAGDPVLLKTPATPDQLKAIPASPSCIDLVWHDNATNEIGYRIERKINGNFKQIGTVGLNDTTFSQNGLLQNTEYTYRIFAFNTDGNSGYSNEASAVTLRAGSGEVVVAVNSGGPSYLGNDGVQYVSDIGAYFCIGGSTYQTQGAISGTQDGQLYQTERYGDFSYRLPVDDGNYEVTLKFAEIYLDVSDTRVFDVKIENAAVLSGLDIFALAGKNSAYDITLPVAINDSILDVVMVPVKENPKLSALVVRKAAPNRVDNGADGSQKPLKYSLSQNYPNPFNPTTVIQFQIANFAFVSLKVYDMLGREAAVLVSEYKRSGVYSVQWNAATYSSGIYFYRLQTGSFTETKKFVLLK